MLLPLTVAQKQLVDKLMNSMSLEEKIGQTLSPEVWNFGEDPQEKHFEAGV